MKVNSLFRNGQLWMTGDAINVKSEFANIIQGRFDYAYRGSVITSFEAYQDVLCNSGFIDHGFVQHTIDWKVNTRNQVEYPFECTLEVFPDGITKRKQFFSDYYDRPENHKSNELIRAFLNIPDMKKRLGNFIYENDKELFEFLSVCQMVRRGIYGKLDEKTFSDVLFSALKVDGGYDNNTSNRMFQFLNFASRKTEANPNGNTQYKLGF